MINEKAETNSASTGLMKSWKKLFTYRDFFIACNIILAFIIVIIPPALVINHRWLHHPPFEYDLYNSWFYTNIKQLFLPNYFLIIFVLFILSMYFFCMLAIIAQVKLPELAAESNREYKIPDDLPPWQIKLSKSLLMMGGIGLAVDAIVMIIRHTIPGIELLVIVFLLLLGLILKEIKLDRIKYFLRKHAGWMTGYIALYLAILVILQYLFNDKDHQWGAGVSLLVLIMAVLTARWYKLMPVVLWISLVALILVAWDINPWHYYYMGIEFVFYKWAALLANSPFAEINRYFFHAGAAIATHTYLVSILQAGFMKIFGVGNFGWRISNPVILSAAVVCFYLFFRKFTKQTTSLLISGMLACSSYLMNFGKIGYDNPQGFFLSGLILWLAAEAIFSHRPVLYALLGLAMGFCFYSYPAALYILPLPVLLMAFFGFPKGKSAIWNWTCWIGMACIVVIPLIIQPFYYTGKSEGLFIYYPDSIAQYGLWFIFGSNLLYSFFSYVFSVGETHYVVASHIDPFSAIWVPIGMAWLIVQVKKNKFALFWILSFLIMWFLAGASHGREYPPETRMLMLLPWWCSFAAFGITWMVEWLGRRVKSAFVEKALSLTLMIIILATNLVQVYWLVPRRYTGRASTGTLFLRLAERVDHDPGVSMPYYIFVTDETWLIDDIQMLQDAYQLPRTVAQLDRIVMNDETLAPGQIIRLQAADTIVIPQAWMEANDLAALTEIMKVTDKVLCPVREEPYTNIMFSAYLPPNLAHLCPVDGNWEE